MKKKPIALISLLLAGIITAQAQTEKDPPSPQHKPSTPKAVVVDVKEYGPAAPSSPVVAKLKASKAKLPAVKMPMPPPPPPKKEDKFPR